MALSTNPMFSPANLLMLSGNILAGPSFAAGLGTGLNQLGTNVAAQQKERDERQREAQETAQMGNYLRSQAPGTDLSNFTPGMVKMAAASALDRQLAPPSKPKFQVLPDGTYGWVDETKQTFNKLGTATKSDLPAIAEEYNFAKSQGFKGSFQDYQTYKAGLNKSGFMIEQGPEGLRVVQGNIDTGKMPKLTEAEGKNAGFYKRALSAEKELSDLESEGTSLWNKAAEAVPVLGNYAKSEDAQKFSQAQRNFINAVLRRESGAVISPEEFANAQQQYFPQPGDGPEVIRQKRQNRMDAIKGFEIGSGPAATKVQEMDQNDSNQRQPIPAEEYFK